MGISKNIKLIFLFIFTLFYVPAAISQYNYVRVEGTHFVLEGKPYYFVGTNFWYGCFIGSTGQTGDTNRLKRELDRLKTTGIDNLRILGASEASKNQNVVQPAIQISPGVYNDSLLRGLDILLSEMGKRDMKAVIFLNNYWNWSGGMSQYLLWFSGGYYTPSFYTNVAVNNAYKHYISDLIRRKNTITGIYYYEDPAIMAWELANESRPGPFNIFYQWIDSSALYIHSIDTNHLVTTGSEGTISSGGSADVFLSTHQSSSIDFATFHLWAYNWGWISPTNMSGTYANALSQATAYIRNHIGYARQLNKPITMEEFGLPRDNGRSSPDSTATFRNLYYDAILQLIYDSASAGAPIAGSNFWGWGGEARSPNTDFHWRVGDPFMCDPPMEAQGLNSVFDTDTSTIAILSKSSLLMASLRVNTGVSEQPAPHDFSLDQNYPNPFNPSTTIHYQITHTEHMTLRVYDMLGREVATLVDGIKEVGSYSAIFCGEKLASGVHITRLIAQSENNQPFM